MQTVGAFEAKTHFSALLEQVQRGQGIVITKHGHPVAKLVPFSGPTQADSAQAIESIKQFASTHTLGKLKWKKLRDEGRR